jgi:hypothetical protein
MEDLEALRRNNVVINEKDISDFQQYETFLKLLNDRNHDFDLSYMNEHKIKDVPFAVIQTFNEELMVCKLEYNFSLLTILAKLSEEYMDTSKIKSYISTEVEWELINEVREKYPNIRKEYSDSDTDKLF